MTETVHAADDGDLARLAATVADFRRQAEANPDSLYPAQADALVQLGTALAEKGRAGEGLVAVAEGVELFRNLAGIEPDVFGVHLASALNNLSNRLTENGRDDDARAAGEQSVAAARSALDARPDQAHFVLVSALVNQAGRRLRAGDVAAALADLASAVDAFREGGAAVAPFLGPMVEGLHRAAMAFTETGMWGEAIDTRRLMLDLFHDGAPPAVVHLLAMTLQQAAVALAGGGRTADALACADEAVELARSLHRADAGQYQLFLAHSLGTLAGRRHEAGDSASGLEVALEAVNLFHDVAQQDPAAAIPALVLTLESLGAILSALGLDEQAATVQAQREQLRGTLEEMVAAGS